MSDHRDAGIHRLPTFDQGSSPSCRMIGSISWLPIV